jgi:predicted permease
MLTDLTLAVRTLRQSPSFTFIAALSLAIGVGASTSVYALTFALFFAPPAGVDHPERLVRICRLENGRPEGHQLSYSEYLYYRDHATVFTELASDGNVKLLTDSEDGHPLLTAVVSPSYFSVLGVQARAGRFFVSSEDTAAGDNQVVVLSHNFWQRRFARDSRTIGGRVVLAGTPYTIVGVAPPDFQGSSAGWASDIFVPTRAVFTAADLANQKNGEDGQLDLIGRLKPGRTLAEAQAELSVLARRLEQAHPETNQTAGVLVSKLRGVDPEARSEQARLPTLLVATVACLLTIACVNLAGLLQTRHAARAKEIAIRLALGAGRGRIVRQLLVESLLLSAIGGAAALVVALWGNTLLERAYAREMFTGGHHFYPLALDARAFLLTLLTAAVTGVLFGVVPALQASRPVLVPALKESSSAPRRSRLRAVFLVVQIALSVVLLIGAALAIQSARAVRQNPGFDPEHVAYFNLNPSRAGYRADKATRYASDLRRRLESLPFVESLSFFWVPPPFWFATADIFLPGQSAARPEDTLKVPVNWVSARFFETLHIRVLQGRGIEQRDIDQRRAVVVLNEALANRLWKGQDAVGRSLVVDGTPFEVAGVVRYEGLRAGGDAARPYLFCSDTGRRQQGSLVVRVKGDVAAALAALRREIVAADAEVPINQAMSMTAVIANQQADVPIAVGVLSFAGGLALLLTTLGLYGVVALWVGQRTREIGIRVALGARSATIVAFVLRDGLRLVVLGVPLGLGLALAGVRLLSRYLYGVTPTDAVTFSAITALFTGVTLAACYIPARRATLVDPVQALRRD